MSDEKKFEREDRYLVVKLSDVRRAIAENFITRAQWSTVVAVAAMIDDCRKSEEKSALECVVVEKDWPEYEVVWGLIEKRVSTESPYAEGQRMFKDGVLLSDTWSSCSPANFANLGEVLRGWEDAKNGVHPES